MAKIVVLVEMVVVAVVIVIVLVGVVAVVKSWPGLVGECKLGAIAGAGFGKYNIGTRASKCKV